MYATLVDSPLGFFGIVWSPRGLGRVLLPLLDDPSGEGMQRALSKLAPVRAPDALGAAWAERLTAHLEGEDVRYDDLVLDEAGLSPFARRVYAAARASPRGATVTDARLAESVGTGAVRAVGGALGKNPTPIVVPCHRIVSSTGAGGFSAPGGLSTKAQLLAAKGNKKEALPLAQKAADLGAQTPDRFFFEKDVKAALTEWKTASK